MIPGPELLSGDHGSLKLSRLMLVCVCCWMQVCLVLLIQFSKKTTGCKGQDKAKPGSPGLQSQTSASLRQENHKFKACLC